MQLGPFHDPLLIFGGPYGNLQATRALLKQAARLGIPTSHILCTGDLVAYCADPQATVDLIREAGIAVVKGNCEESLAERLEDCGCGFEGGTACDLLSQQWYAYADTHLTDESRDWMGSLPERSDITIGERRLAAIHGGVSSINKFVFASTPEDVLAYEMNLAGLDGVIGGHSGLPFTRIACDRLWHNSGVIGMPANDGTPRVWYSVLTPIKDGVAVSHHALSYDHSAAAVRMRAELLPAGYADCLVTGLWPSLDVLPDQEKAATGDALQEYEIDWFSPALASALT